MSSTFSFTGVEELLRRLEQEAEGMRNRAVGAVEQEAQNILANTHPPVESGKLAASGRVESAHTDEEISSSVVYGNEDAYYAPFVHEMPGEGHKFLERPFVEAENGMNTRLSNRIKK